MCRIAGLCDLHSSSHPESHWSHQWVAFPVVGLWAWLLSKSSRMDLYHSHTLPEVDVHIYSPLGCGRPWELYANKSRPFPQIVLDSLYLSSDYWSQNDSVFLVRMLATLIRFRLVPALRLKVLHYSGLPSTIEFLPRFAFLCDIFTWCLSTTRMQTPKAHVDEDHCSPLSTEHPRMSWLGYPFSVCYSGLGFTLPCYILAGWCWSEPARPHCPVVSGWVWTGSCQAAPSLPS